MEALWTPSPERVARANLTRFLRQTGHDDYWSLYRWSVGRPEEFWPALWRFADILASSSAAREPWSEPGFGLSRMAPPDPVQGPRWFPEARLNFAENLLRWRDERPAIIARAEGAPRRELGHAELHRAAHRVAAALRAHGIQPGDRVAGYMPNVPETVIAMLGTALVGATWSSCSPDFGVDGVVDRFGQIAPRVLFTADGYRWAGEKIRCLPRAAEVARRIPAIERVVVVPFLGTGAGAAKVRDAALWDDWLAESADEPPPRFAFDHPLYILYSSGTTGLPKCMIHGAGGTLLQHRKEHALHVDVTREDRMFYFTTCGWMMWNWLVSGLAAGATIVLYDGAPLHEPDMLWRLAEEERVTIFGTSAKFLAMAEKTGLSPGRSHDLSALREVVTTGSPLAGHGYDWTYGAVKQDLHLNNISGGTEIISCFAIGNPTLPVFRGEMQAPGLGMAVSVFDPDGAPLEGEPGELVCTRPFPSMPVGFWNDPDRAKYRAAYFERFPSAWRHGDWAERTPRGGIVIHGRSDATLNPGGVRIGTAEIYRQVEALPEVLECLAIGQRVETSESTDERIVLFVRLKEGRELDSALRARIRRRIRERASPRHVPRTIVQVSDIPRTISGKISELAVRAVVHGLPVLNRDALANPEALEQFKDRL